MAKKKNEDTFEFEGYTFAVELTNVHSGEASSSFVEGFGSRSFLITINIGAHPFIEPQLTLQEKNKLVFREICLRVAHAMCGQDAPLNEIFLKAVSVHAKLNPDTFFASTPIAA